MASRNKSQKFECPVCYNVILSRVYQCRNGHLICADCVEKCRTCPTCRVPMPTGQDGRIRNLELEKVIRGKVHNCPHEGCKERLKVDDYTEHKMNCLYREADFCSLLRVRESSSCDGVKLNELTEHFQNDDHEEKAQVHGNVFGDYVTFSCDFSSDFVGVYTNIYCVTSQSSLGKKETFPIVVVETTSEDGLVYWSPMILASPSFVARFVVDIEIRPERVAGSTSWKLDPKNPDVPVLHFKGVVPHCPESGGEAWALKDDPCVTLTHLEKLANYAFLKYKHHPECYALRVRLYDKNEQRFYRLQCPDDDKDHDNDDDRGNESDSTSNASSEGAGAGEHSSPSSCSSTISSAAANRRFTPVKLRRAPRISRRPFRSPRRGAGVESHPGSLSELGCKKKHKRAAHGVNEPNEQINSLFIKWQ